MDSPQPNPKPGTVLTAPPPYVSRTSQSFEGDPSASPAGWVSGTGTSGNNAVVGGNNLGVRFLREPVFAIAPDRDFRFPLDLAPGTASLASYQDASTANLFYWVNRSHDLFYAAGFNEASGNYQENNFGKGGVGGDPIFAYSFYQSAAPGAAALQNAFYTNLGSTDGTPSMLAFLLSYGADGGFTDNSFDSVTVVHEYAHGVSNRLVRELSGHQGRSMGEAWSDFFSLEFTLPDGAPLDGVYPYSEYPEQTWGAGIRTRPYTTNLDVNPLGYQHLGRVFRFPEVHADGEIFALALWEIRANLIRQHGEREGRRRARLLVVDGMKLSPPSPSMVDARDAILLADRAAFNGASQEQIWKGFAKRGLGVLAMSEGTDTVHVAASFEEPSNKGQLRFYESQYIHGEPVRLVLHDGNLTGPVAQVRIATTGGDLETMNLQREGLVYRGIAPSSINPVGRGNGFVNLAVGDSITAFYADVDTGAGSQQVEASATTLPSYTASSPGASRFTFERETNLNYRAPFGATPLLLTLPFEFPYFGRKYPSLWLFNNGLVSFDLPVLTPCTDTGSLFAYNAIAPLWNEMNTLGTAQQNEGVYISRPAPDQITIRWAGGTDVFLGVRPEPLNFAMTLFEDGRIQFHYGTGNKNLAIGQANSSCGAVSTPTVGISRGTDAFALYVPTHSGMASLENAPSIVLDPPFGNGTLPGGHLESPAEGATVGEAITFSGYVFDDFSPVSRIDLYVDGVYSGRFGAGARNPACAQRAVCGTFSAIGSSTTLGLAPGPHKAWLRVTNTRGGFTDFPDQPVSFTIAPEQTGEPAGRIESPSEGQEVTGAFTIRGWAFGRDTRVVGVEVLIDGVSYTRATYPQARADVCNELDPRPALCPNIGFQARIDPAASPVPLTNGSHKMQIRVQEATGRYVVLPDAVSFTVNNPANQPPSVVLTSIKNGDKVSGRVPVSGHAWDADGRVVRVAVVVDYVGRGNATLGGARPEACAELTEVEACPNIGFDFELDTRTLSNGLHSLYLLAIDDKGLSTRLPGGFLGVFNIFVENSRETGSLPRSGLPAACSTDAPGNPG